jgi:hypothetical protein
VRRVCVRELRRSTRNFALMMESQDLALTNAEALLMNSLCGVALVWLMSGGVGPSPH